jgi:hypothetical protein
VWQEAAAIVGRYPAQAVIPGAVLGAIAEAPHYIAGERLVIGNVLTSATAALAYYLYLAYAEEIVIEYERETERIAPRDVLRELRDVLRLAYNRSGAVGGYLVSGSHTWGEWIGGSVLAAIAIPLAAFTTLIAYQCLARAP